MENEKKLETAIDEAIAIAKSEDEKKRYDTAVSLEEYVRKYSKDEINKVVENYAGKYKDDETTFIEEFAKKYGYSTNPVEWTEEVRADFDRYRYINAIPIEKKEIVYVVDEKDGSIERKKDMVKNPKHYIFQIGEHEFQAIQVCKAVCTPEEFRGYLKTSYINYLLRADRKNGVEDLEKALTYLRWQIEFDKTGDITLPAK